MISRAKPLRPAWRGMGWWKWPSVLLLLFCIGITFPYIQRSGGSNGMSAAPIPAELHDCPLDYEVRAKDGAVTVLARIAARCATTLSPPEIALMDNTGAPLSGTVMRGDPNSLRGRFQLPDDVDADQLRLTITATDLHGAEASVDATALLAAQLNAQSNAPGQEE